MYLYYNIAGAIMSTDERSEDEAGRSRKGAAAVRPGSSDKEEQYGGMKNGNDNDAEDSGGSRRTGPCGSRTADEADLDLVLGNDITSPVAIHEMDKMTGKGVFDKDKIALSWIILSRIRISNPRSTANA